MAKKDDAASKRIRNMWPDLDPPYVGCACSVCLEEDYHKRVKSGVKMNTLIFVHPIWLMILCSKCGNKRCPHATDHNNACTNSNEPGQKGSKYV
jgi:hypothetical protein